ncbi:MAG TPA: DNA repair helicase XPB [Planctomycetota bacterium]|nr:DNA repair helicase XPB [Planctomycetota bacterium]
MEASAAKPLIVQGDRTVFLEVRHPAFKETRDRLMGFAELEKSPEYVHIYRITPLSLWNAAAAGIQAEEIIEFLATQGKYPVPASLRKEITDFIGRYGQIKLISSSLPPLAGSGSVSGRRLELWSSSPEALEEVLRARHLEEYFLDEEWDGANPGLSGAAPPRRQSVGVKAEFRGQLKVALIKLGYPVEDLAGYREGAALDVRLREALPDKGPFCLRPYQVRAVEAFHAGGAASGGSGVIVLPCGAGKTIVGIGVIEQVRAHTLILSTNITALRQWKRELLEKTTLEESQIGEYSGAQKQVRPITLTTYQMLTYRKSRCDDFLHFRLFTARDWGLIVYDEVHLLPAPVFRLAAELQATRRLGLTATLVREDGREDEVFSLIGPRKYDIPWRSLESQGWIAGASCVEIRVDMPPDETSLYAMADQRGKFRIASENRGKLSVVKDLVERHQGDRVLIIGQYLDQLKAIRRELGAPIITGKTSTEEREALYASFRSGEIPVLIVSKVGNFAVDLPDANVAVQVSGTFGSRQEEAQRLGRILRPKSDSRAAVFYSIVTRASRDQDFSEKRQLFLTEQGYHYTIRDESWKALGSAGALVEERARRQDSA